MEYGTNVIPLTAWSVSLNPRGDTYASTGGSGNVSIHSAQTDNFGERLSTVTSGRNKFGMFCSYVRCYLTLCPNYSKLTGSAEPRRTPHRHVLGNRANLHLRRRIKRLIYHIHLSRNVCTFIGLVARFKCMFSNFIFQTKNFMPTDVISSCY